MVNSFSHYINLISPHYGTGRVFSDFLEITLCAIQLGAAEDRYFQIIQRYDAPDLEVFSKAFAALTLEMTGDGSGLVDVLGEFFEKEISRGLNGQFFSPQPICDMLTGIIRSNGPGYRVADPSCGSGRMLLSAAKLNRSLQFFGADNDLTCVHMSVINLCLNGLFGEIAWMDTLTGSWYRSYRIEMHPKGVPFVRQINQEESQVALKIPVPTEQKRTVLKQQLVFNF